MNHRQFLEKLHLCNEQLSRDKVRDDKPLVPVARYAFGTLEIAVYQNDILRLAGDALVCGKLTPVNPVGVLFREFWDAGLAWGYTRECPTGLGSPVDDEVVVKLERSHPTASEVRYDYIGVVNPRDRTIKEQLTRTLVELGREFGCSDISLIAPTYGEPNFLRSASASDIVASIFDAATHTPLKRVDLVDEWNPQPFVDVLGCHENLTGVDDK